MNGCYAQNGRVLRRWVVCSLVSVFLISVLLAPSSCFAQGRPQAVVSEKIFDFGSVSQGSVVKHDFIVKNTGDADLVVQRVIAACGCTAASASNDPVKPGQETAIHVAFDTSGFSGEKYKTVRVNTNDIDNLSIVLALRGVVEPDVLVEPQSVMLNDVVRGSSDAANTKLVTVSTRESSGVKITGVRAFSPYVKISQIEPSDTKYKFVVGIDPSAPLGEIRDRVVIGVQGGKESTVNVPVFASVRGQLVLQPSQVSFGVIEGSEPLVRSVKFSNRGSSPVRVTEVRSSNPAVTASVREIEAGKNYVVQVKVDPAKVSKDLRAAVEILTDSAQEPSLSLSLFGVLPPKA